MLNVFHHSLISNIDCSLLEALQLIAGGAQNLVVPITSHASRCECPSKGGVVQKHAVTQKSAHPLQRSHNGQAYCWLTHEDVLRFLLGSIAVFSPLPMMSIEDLGIIDTNVGMVKIDSAVVSVLDMIRAACLEMTAVAVVDDADDVLGAFNFVGDISCTTLQTCNETAALALATLSAGDFLIYAQDCRNPADVLVDLIRARLFEKLCGNKGDGSVSPPLSKAGDMNLFLQDLEMLEESSSDGEESGADSPTGPHDLSGKWSTHLRASRMGCSFKSRSGPIFCNPKSSLVAVLLQALAHRENYVWVMREDGTLLGIVTFSDILTVMLNHVNI
eukprot:c24341_g1_i2 orf=1049-2041(+)